MAVQCKSLDFTVRITPDPDNPGFGLAEGVSPPGRLTTSITMAAHFIHPWDFQEVCPRIMRVVQCQAGCIDDEYLYCIDYKCFPVILPPGIYEFSFPEQLVSDSIVPGDYETTLLFEPVDDAYVAAAKTWC